MPNPFESNMYSGKAGSLLGESTRPVGPGFEFLDVWKRVGCRCGLEDDININAKSNHNLYNIGNLIEMDWF